MSDHEVQIVSLPEVAHAVRVVPANQAGRRAEEAAPIERQSAQIRAARGQYPVRIVLSEVKDVGASYPIRIELPKAQ